MAITPKELARRYGVGEKWIRQVAREESGGHRPHQRWQWHGWDDPDLQPILKRLENGHTLNGDATEWDLTVSSKNQITIPVSAMNALDVRPGDKLRAVVRGRSLQLLPHPVSWVDYYAGAAEGLYGQSKEDIDSYIREVRGDWEP